MWRTWMEQDGEGLIAVWKKTPVLAPTTLREFRESGALSVIPAEFNVSGDFARQIRKAVKLEVAQPK